MAALELCPLSEHLEESDVETLVTYLEESDVDNIEFGEDGESVPLEQHYDDDVFIDFWDQLDANEVACDVYLPLEFEDVVEVDGRRYGSAHALLIVLANIKEDMFLDDDDASEAIEDGDDELEEFDDYGGGDDEQFASDEINPTEVKDEQMRRVWRAMHKGAKVAVDQGLALFVHE